MNNCAIIIFGATGDLTKRKLIPAIYRLLAAKRLDNFVLIGAAIDDTTAEVILENAKEFISDCDERVWQDLKDRTYYQKLNFLHEQDFATLRERVETLEKEYNLPGNRLFYLAAAALHFCPITHNIGESGLAVRTNERHKGPWQRIVYEKPFGHDLGSAHEINECIAHSFDENQIYRIDHYLTKELVSNISLIRFTNIMFEPLWSNQYIDQVQIILSEEKDIAGRGGYYDVYGALRDVVQNHMLELVALIGMEQPKKLAGDFIRAERAKVLERVRVLDGVLGQYEDYKQEKGVNPDSKTDTFVSLALTINNERWKGVPFYLKTGKALDKKETIIHIKFKQVDCLLLRGCPMESNWLTIKVAPAATFLLSLNAKRPGRVDELIPVVMEFCHSCIFGERVPEEAYEVLLDEIMRGEQSISVRFDEIEYAWRVIDAIKAKKFPLYTYKKGSTGPKEIEKFEKKHGMRWRS